MRNLQVLTLGCILLSTMLTAIPARADQDALQQRHIFRHLTIEDGLSQSSVNCMLQDRDGFAWLGTQDGLNRYDGHEFRVWKTDADDPLTLSDAYITCFAEDADGNLWVGSEASGFAHFDRASGALDFLCTGPPRSGESTGANYEILDLAVDETGVVWLGTRVHGLLRYDPTSGELRSWRQAPDALPADEVTALLLDRDGKLWVGTTAGLVCFDRDSEQLCRWRHQPGNLTSLSGDIVQALLQTPAGNLWIGTDGGLDRYLPGGDSFEHHLEDVPLGPRGVGSLAVDADGVLWVGGEDAGLIRYDTGTRESFRFGMDLATPDYIPTVRVQALLVDAAGVVWVGHDLGASLLDTNAEQFYHFHHRVDEPNSLSHNTVWSLCEDRGGKLWICTENGLNSFDPETGQFEMLAADPDDPRRPSSNRMIAVKEDLQGRLWLGNSLGGLDIRDPQTGIFRHVALDSTGLHGAPSLRVYDVEEAPDGTVWIGTLHGVQSWDPETDVFTAYFNEPGSVGDVGGVAVKSIEIEPSGAIWLGTWGNGVLRIDPATGARDQFRHSSANKRSITSDTVVSLLRDSQGRVWVGTGAGLNRLDPLTGLVTRLTEKDGLPNNTIYALAEDAQGRIWASSNFGLVALDPETLDFAHYQAKDGCQSNEFNMGAGIFGRSGRMYFGGINGFNVFYPERIQANPYIPPVVITDFRINNRSLQVGVPDRGREMLTVPVERTEQVNLDHRDHVVSLSFTALHYAAPDKNRYQYLLEGFDTVWTEAGERTHATYTNLPPGRYVFRVRGSNSDGVWNEEGAQLAIDVRPPFWKTPWFLTLLALLGLSAINGIIRYRTRLMKVRTQDLEKRVARRTADLTRANHFLQQEIGERRRVEEALRVAKEEAEEATRAKSEFLANMSHEIRTPMNGVLGMTSVLLEGELIQEHREHLEVVYASARNLLGIINDILDFSKIEAGKLELECIDFDLRNLVEEVGEMLGPRARDKGLEFLLRVNHDVPSGLRSDPVRVRQILVNLVNNAIKFTDAGRVVVRVALAEGARTDRTIGLRFEIEDTGVGIPTDRMDCLFESFSQVDASTTRQYGGTGLGLAISKQLVDLMEGEIGVSSEHGTGTTFWFQLGFGHSQEPVEEPATLSGRVVVVMPDPEARRAAAETLRYLGCEPVAPEIGGDPAQTAIMTLANLPDCLAVISGTWNQDPATRRVPRKLRSALGSAAPPCLAVFCLGEALDGDVLREAGYAGWITRPLRTRKLREALMALADGGQAPQDLPEAPLVDAADRIPGPTPRALDPEPDTVSLPILLAEDNPVNQKVASILLTKLGYDVDVVGNGAEAIEALANRRYSLVFMDVQMPVMDGYEAVRRIRAGQAQVLQPRVPIIALTAHAMKGDRQRCLDAGMDDYLAKPIDQQAMVVLLDRFLGVRRPVSV